MELEAGPRGMMVDWGSGKMRNKRQGAIAEAEI